MASWAVEMVGATLGVEQPYRRVVIWRRWVGEIRVTRVVLNRGCYHGSRWCCCVGGAVGEALAECHRRQVMKGGA